MRNVVLVELGMEILSVLRDRAQQKGEDETMIPFGSCLSIFDRKPPGVVSAVLVRRMLGRVA